MIPTFQMAAEESERLNYVLSALTPPQRRALIRALDAEGDDKFEGANEHTVKALKERGLAVDAGRNRVLTPDGTTVARHLSDLREKMPTLRELESPAFLEPVTPEGAM
ncbi:hypothetical protein [Streptomyces sp. 5-10]|uniref:hypothetical protein n=1 Tax=Streptomyces sp. 5-10 TaxID=878925 RepID=UPI00168B882C|nr:hypothetical protein [Streptomyces sp. 5-10]MBD3004620.1 hypothetical protein [Streptomyces sp. 5-10]